MIEKQKQQLEAQVIELRALRDQTNDQLAGFRGTGTGPATAVGPVAQTAPTAPSTVGASPTLKPDIQERAQAVPQGLGVLTPAGRTTVQVAASYIRASNDRLVFAGIELVPGLQIGSIQASTAQRNTLNGSVTVWHGLTDRLEAELTVPVLSRNDTISLAQVRNGVVSEGFNLKKTALGDIEGALRWQLNAPTEPDKPILVAGVRVKSNTGVSPFSITYDEFGIAQGLATGSGFWGIQPNLTMMIPSDPVVIYSGLSYLYQVPRNVNRTVGDALVGRVAPGGALAANIGFGFSLNPRFSFSLGYTNTYVFPTRTQIDGTPQKSTALELGTLDLGMSYRINRRQTVNFAFQFGVTQDAPDVAITLRLPITF